MQETGFLGTAAPQTADLALVLEMGMGTALLAGAWLARMGRIQFHAICQSVIVLLNLGLIVLTMFPAFHRQVLPKLPGRIGRPYYALAVTHASLGGVAGLGGLYILLAVRTRLLPEKIRITCFRFCNRSLSLVWGLVLLLGIAPYPPSYM